MEEGRGGEGRGGMCWKPADYLTQWRGGGGGERRGGVLEAC